MLGEGLGDNLLEVVKQASRELQHTDDTLIKHVHELLCHLQAGKVQQAGLHKPACCCSRALLLQLLLPFDAGEVVQHSQQALDVAAAALDLLAIRAAGQEAVPELWAHQSLSSSNHQVLGRRDAGGACDGPVADEAHVAVILTQGILHELVQYVCHVLQCCCAPTQALLTQQAGAPQLDVARLSPEQVAGHSVHAPVPDGHGLGDLMCKLPRASVQARPKGVANPHPHPSPRLQVCWGCGVCCQHLQDLFRPCCSSQSILYQ